MCHFTTKYLVTHSKKGELVQLKTSMVKVVQGDMKALFLAVIYCGSFISAAVILMNVHV